MSIVYSFIFLYKLQHILLKNVLNLVMEGDLKSFYLLTLTKIKRVPLFLAFLVLIYALK